VAQTMYTHASKCKNDKNKRKGGGRVRPMYHIAAPSVLLVSKLRLWSSDASGLNSTLLSWASICLSQKGRCVSQRVSTAVIKKPPSTVV
jgi:hypothetical protein